MRQGLTGEHPHLIATLLDESVAAEVARKYPDDSAAQDLASRPIWEPVGVGYARLLDAVVPVAAE